MITIMRGLPGSGKSTLAKERKGVVVSADHYFIDNQGAYVYVPSKAGAAHAACFRGCVEALREGLDVVVDNTSLEVWEYEKYILAAWAQGVDVIEIVTIECSSADDLDLCKRRQTHGVPEDVLDAMAERMDTTAMWPPVPSGCSTPIATVCKIRR